VVLIEFIKTKTLRIVRFYKKARNKFFLVTFKDIKYLRINNSLLLSYVIKKSILKEKIINTR